MNKQELKEKLVARNDDVQTFITWQLEKRGGHAKATRFALDLIDQLDEPEITKEQAWEVIGGYNGMTNKEANQVFADGMVDGKPEVPQFVADWYEKNKFYLEENVDSLIRNSRNSDERRPIVKWMLDKTNRPIETLIRMKEGYTIEPPKTLQVIVKNYDSTVYKKELPEDEAMKLIEGWKG